MKEKKGKQMAEHKLGKDEIDSIADALVERIRRGHVCRFEDAQAAVLHEAAKRLSPDDVIAVAWLAHLLQETAEKVGKRAAVWAARMTLAGGVTLILVGIVGVSYAIKRGWISIP